MAAWALANPEHTEVRIGQDGQDSKERTGQDSRQYGDGQSGEKEREYLEGPWVQLGGNRRNGQCLFWPKKR